MAGVGVAAAVFLKLDNSAARLHYPPAMVAVQVRGIKPELIVVAALVAMYVAARVAIGVLGRPDGSAPGRRALAQWLPVPATALAAVFMGAPDIAIGVVFGTSVASLSLVLGMTTYLAPLQQLPPNRRVWPLVLPATIVSLVAGFSGRLTLFHAVLLLAMGGAFLAVWLEPPATDPAAPVQAGFDDVSGAGWGFVAVALLVMALAAWGAVYGATHTAMQSRVLTPALLAAAILSPLLVLPALGESGMLAQRGYCGQAVTALVGTVLLNLCALLPVLVFAHRMMLALARARGAGEAADPLPYPLSVWRVDTVVLLLLAFALVPVAMGRWLPERFESILLVVIYAAYLVVETMLAARLF